jgi:hypothetical protein
MSEQADITSNPASRTFPVLPRDYCTIDRAARILGCEVEDILQWGAEGSIPLMVNFDQWGERVFGVVYDPHERQPDEDGFINLDCARTWYELADAYDDIQEIRGQSGDIEDMPLFRLGGFWLVAKDDVYWNFLGYPLDTLGLSAPNKDFMPMGEADALAIVLKFDNPFPTYWVSRHSLNLLKKHIESGEKLAPNTMLNASSSSPKAKIHPRTLGSAIDREKILVAAIYVKDKVGNGWFHDPKDTDTTQAKGWAYKIICNQERLFEGGECPLSESKIERILGSAMNHGKPNKSP